jgi:hypothetical protein
MTRFKAFASSRKVRRFNLLMHEIYNALVLEKSPGLSADFF